MVLPYNYCIHYTIGDGGNEIGMGKIHSRVIASSITNAAEIACVVPTDHLLVCSVSNWGGYALAAAAAVVDCATRQQEGRLNCLLFCILFIIFGFYLL